MLTRKKKNISKKYHFNKKISLEQQCSVLLHYWLALKLNWTKLQHTILQLDKTFFRKYFSNLIYRVLSIKTLSTWELWLFLRQRKSRKTTPNKSMTSPPPASPPPSLENSLLSGTSWRYFLFLCVCSQASRYKNVRLPVPSFLIRDLKIPRNRCTGNG